LLAQGKLGEAEKEIQGAEVAAATTESRLLGIDALIVAARTHAAAGKVAGASRSLAAVLAEASKLGCGRCRFEARLGLAEIEMKQGKSTARERLAALEKDAASEGFLLIARQAHAAASK
jgi:hypothetical protein